MKNFFGRDKECNELDLAYNSKKPAFIALFGRRRVGKTFLIDTMYSTKKDAIFFSATGIKDGKISEQIQNFTERIGSTFIRPGVELSIKTNWRDTFLMLTEYINASPKKKIVLFFDEFPWMATRKSQLLETLQYFWNQHWSKDPRIKLIICGSSASWILKNIVNDIGGLYNRVTHRIHLEPFNLYQTKGYLAHRGLKLTNKQVVQIYMVLGGIPHYLDQVKSSMTAMQSIEALAFSKNSFLFSEFKNLYATLFGAADGHVEIARLIAQHHYGIAQEELAAASKKLSSGGALTKRLEDLIEAGFIERFTPFSHKKKGVLYKMIDEYSLFYFHWIEPLKDTLLERGMRKGYWESIQRSQSWHSWAGYAFESICYKHIPCISVALKLSPTAIPYVWRYQATKVSTDQGAQIDLLFDRNDDAITLCEIKYTENSFEIDKQYAVRLIKKQSIFVEKTKTEKQIFLIFIAANGLKKNMYSEAMVSDCVILDDFFKSDIS